MRVPIKKIRQVLLVLFFGFGSVNAGVSFFIGEERSWRWSLVFLALACAVWGTCEGIVHLYAKYAPSRLGDSTIHLMGDNSGSSHKR
jgi:hypothetical protein